MGGSVMPNSNYKLVRLANGTFSIHSLAEKETFHPVVGPVAEAQALYIEQLKLRQRLQAHAGEFVIWDVGLGAGGNVLAVFGATADLACPLRVVSFDRTTEALRICPGTRRRTGLRGALSRAGAGFFEKRPRRLPQRRAIRALGIATGRFSRFPARRPVRARAACHFV